MVGRGRDCIQGQAKGHGRDCGICGVKRTGLTSNLQVCISYHFNFNGLHLLVDSTGVKMLSEGEWRAKKMAPSIAANGASCTWVSMPKPWKFGQSR